MLPYHLVTRGTYFEGECHRSLNGLVVGCGPVEHGVCAWFDVQVSSILIGTLGSIEAGRLSADPVVVVRARTWRGLGELDGGSHEHDHLDCGFAHTCPQ